ncbi:MAG: hypothetical protein WCT40_03775 [Candidatus Magasanikbacteria bacterium]|jgi:hypothetical protein
MLANKNISLREIFAKFTPSAGDRYFAWRLTSIILAGMIVASGLCAAGFVYKNIYSSISNSYIVFALNSKLSADSVDMAVYEKMRAKISAKKTTVAIPAGLRYIFDYDLPTVVSSTKK